MKLNKEKLRAGFLFLSLIAPCGLLVFGQSAPILLNFQGRLTNSVGAPITALIGIQLTLLRGGTASEPVSTGTIVYQETTSVTPDANGVFTHVVGTGTPVGGQTLVAEDFDTSGVDLFIETSISGEILLPRTQVLSVPYAIESSRVGGLTAQAIIGQSGGNAFANAVVRNGAVLEWLSTEQVKVNAGTLGFPDGVVRRNTTSLTWDITNPVGLLGLDAGTEAADTWYYLHAVPDPVDGTQFSVIASLNAPSQVGGAGPFGPAGYGTHRYLGAIRNGSTSNIMRFYRAGDTVYWRGRVLRWLDIPSGAQPAASVDAWTTIDASVAMPETSRAVVLNGYYDSFGGAAFRFYVAPLAGSYLQVVEFCDDWEGGATSCDLTLPTINRTFAYFADLADAWTNDASQGTLFGYRGYVEDLDEY